ncbi:Hypothetical protein GbCGDNIH9_0483 [Granulibacter bethesdensis]|uniref:COQ9 C-terminal domain-containing protein n=1 Tax=Granulibacter bethesdensis TaxID=364410 RepID=A0AAC9KBI3_9PROT|nr:COQ9 family protein [Granulibacter bethesdensis]APH53722.1 Hypothetical protein GbCGDNIH9_0483 [Granulibacter bethesdensis]APH61301.1 Hypothetical protein GbCGDNIH8_0483 [Granulibacter bethesdensis]
MIATLDSLVDDTEQDRVIAAMLPHVPVLGWTETALRSALSDLNLPPEDAPLFWHGGAAGLIEAWSGWLDRAMTAEVEQAAGVTKLSARVRLAIAARLSLMGPHREAARRAAAALALPGRARVAARCLARTVDAIWYAAGDRSADTSWYTKRVILAGIWSGTLLVWLRERYDHDEAALAFLDRRLAGVTQFGRLKARITGGLAGGPSASHSSSEA